MQPRRSARLAAKNAAAAQPPIRRAAFLRAVEAIIPVARRRRSTITGNRPGASAGNRQRRFARNRADNQPSAEDPPIVLPFQGLLADALPRAMLILHNFLPYRIPGNAGLGDAAQTASENTIATDIGVRRLYKEMENMTSDPTDGCTVELVDDCIYNWRAVIIGPSETPYEDGHFQLHLRFPPMYPSQPPYVQFRTKIYHCNIIHGAICMDILGANWSPALTVDKLLLSIRSLLADPNPESPLNCGAAEMYKTDRAQHDRLAREYTVLYAKPAASSENS